MGIGKKFQFILMTYAPLMKGDAVAIGIILLESEDAKSQVVGVRFISDWKKLARLDPDADVEILKAITNDLEKVFNGPPAGRENLLKQIEDSFSNTIQISDRKDFLSSDAASAMDELKEQYLSV